MVDLQTVSILITGLGLTIGILYYALELRDSNKSRQAQLWMQLTESFRDREFLKQYNEILYHQKWESHDDWVKKYGVEKNIEANTKITSVLSLFETVGVLVKHNLIDKKKSLRNRHPLSLYLYGKKWNQ